MAYTRISDIVTPSVFNPYFLERTAEISTLVRSGIVTPDAAIDVLAKSGGKTVNMPFFKDLTGTSEIIGGGSSASSLDVNKITTGTDIAVLFMRGKAWGVNDLAEAISGADPMAAIGDLVAEWWNRDEQTTLLNVLAGMFSDNLDNDSGDLISNVSRGSATLAAAANLIGPETLTDAQYLLGDNANKLTAVMMHSALMGRLIKQKAIDYVWDETISMNIPYYMDKRVIVNDNCPRASAATAGYLYTSYLFGEGAIARGEGAAPVPTETDRDALAGDDILVTRRHFLLHPRGIAFQSASVADNSPTNAEAAQASNWNRVYEKKNIRIVKLVTNG